MVDTLAAFGLAYVFVKFFVGVLGEVKHAGLVLVHDRPGFHKILLCVVALSCSVVVLLIIVCECTCTGAWCTVVDMGSGLVWCLSESASSL